MSEQETAGGEDRREGEGEAGKDGEKKTPIFRKPLFWIILIAVVATLVIGGTLYYLHARQFESTDDAFVDAHIVRIAPEVAGTLVQVADIDNRHVKAGDLLAVIKPNGPEAQLAEAQAGVGQAQAQFSQAQAQIAAATATRDQTRAQSLAPLAAATKAAQDLARYENLARIDRSAVAATQLDQARANARSTAAEAAAARRQVASADAQIAVARKAADAANAAVAARRAQAQQARITLGDLRLTAPVSGQVVNRQVNTGSYVGPGSQIMAIVPDTMWITANFKETQLKDMRIGQEVAIKVDAFPDVKFRGRVDSIQRGAGQAFSILPPQNATGNYVKVVQRVPVRITFVVSKGDPDPRNYPIGPGMSVVPTVKVR
ncbi:HlyD family secretion protein [Sphingomonas sp.]|jgi:membrane fusion protein (multidrug efflux system)|uniref:HlyD family secretion protein n=1 Tax=Sphingomonas sp. TaxID=28214 RepID=UPI002E2EC54B|nr:HlyD family secretion protein [Sphingomonas sp.]HEX4693401.1 HlyD family secretion protein [Sphingomonas sp.]